VGLKYRVWKIGDMVSSRKQGEESDSTMSDRGRKA